MNLVIIEGAGKVSTIKKYLGSDYEVFATKGHIRDLPKKTLAIDIENNFEPKYVAMPDKKEIIKELKAKASKCDKIYLATDPDREGEAISWHVSKLIDLDENKECRIVFNEISKKAIDNALKKPRAIDKNLVDAQQARRVLDRLVGYQLSPYINRRVSGKNLSAGRVQSVALKLVVDREREIEAFVPVESYLINAHLNKANKDEFVAALYGKEGKKYKPSNKEQADEVLAGLKGASYAVTDVAKKVTSSSAPPPYITSSMQRDAYNKLGMSLARSGSSAQALYEGVTIKGEGKFALVTYIRTDSMRISTDAQEMAREFIQKNYGDKYIPDSPNVFKNKSGAQDAHEAIRPVHLDMTPEKVKASLTSDQYRLYKMIFDRFVASQMTPATYDSVVATIAANNYTFKASGKTPVFDGWTRALKFDKEKVKKTDDEENSAENTKLPVLNVGDILNLIKLDSIQKFTKPPSRYNDGSLIDAMKEKGIGRPATYKPTLDTIYKRLYVEKVEKNMKPTELGFAVCDLLVKNFADIINVEFTAKMEQDLDDIEGGEKIWQDEVAKFYKDFERDLKKAGENTEKIKIAPVLSDEICEKCGKPMAIRQGKYGKFLGCTGYPECKTLKRIEKPAGKCPICGMPMAQRRSKAKGTIFYGCTGYPNCTFLSWNEVLDKKCPKCQQYLELKKTKDGQTEVCSNKQCDYKNALKEEEKKDE